MLVQPGSSVAAGLTLRVMCLWLVACWKNSFTATPTPGRTTTRNFTKDSREGAWRGCNHPRSTTLLRETPLHLFIKGMLWSWLEKPLTFCFGASSCCFLLNSPTFPDLGHANSEAGKCFKFDLSVCQLCDSIAQPALPRSRVCWCRFRREANQKSVCFTSSQTRARIGF